MARKPSKDMYWDIDFFSSRPVPLNVDEVIDEANSLIDAVSFDMDDTPDGEEDLRAYCRLLWRQFNRTGCVGSITAVYPGMKADSLAPASPEFQQPIDAIMNFAITETPHVFKGPANGNFPSPDRS